MLTCLVIGRQGQAQTISIISPPEYADREGEEYSPEYCCPFSFRYQSVFPAEHFAALPGGKGWLTEIAWRPDGNAVTGPYSTNLGPTVINVSVTDKDVLSTTFEQNLTNEQIKVFEGEIPLHTENLGPVGGPKEFDYVMRFQKPYYYDTSRGNLFFDWFLSEGFALSTLGDSPSAPLSALFATPVTTPSGTRVSDFVQNHV